MSDGKLKGKKYYPDDFRWPECPVSALTRERPDGFDPIGLVQILCEARSVGGKGAVLAMAKRDPRMYDAAVVIEACRSAEHIVRLKVK